MYFVTLAQFQLHNLRNSDEDLVNNAQLLRLLSRGKINSTPRKTWNEVLDKDMSARAPEAIWQVWRSPYQS